MRWINKVDTAILLCEKECLIEVFLEPFEVDIQVLGHYHVLAESYVRLASLVLADWPFFREMNLEIHLHALHREVGAECLLIVDRFIGNEESNLEVLIRNISSIIFGAVV